ncbi:MAG: nodulation protein NfeD [Mariprofundaceae bacterium]|nr:nodulation protein NfeD [Mariprofundaceae bacterium]
MVLVAFLISPAAHAASPVLQLDIKGAIGPAVSNYVEHGLEQAKQMQAQLVILRMDTPGGLDQSMRSIIQAILASPVPVATFVAPSGSRAASAGTYILYASHIAAMAPGTNLGAATPVQISGIGGGPSSPSPPLTPPKLPEKLDKNAKPAQEQKAAPPNDSSMHRKMVNDAAAYIRSLAQMRGRNADWAEKAVRQAASLSATQALEKQVIDLMATNAADLLGKLDGKTIKTVSGEHTLHTVGITIEKLEPSWPNRMLSIITDPNVAYILMLLGVYGLFFELANPGFVLPGVIGGICLLLALFAFQVLPVNFAGLALIGLGIAFMIAEVFMPSFGALGLGGVIAFIIGSIMLMDTGVPGFALSLALIIGVALTSAAFFILIASMALKARRRPVVSGSEEMVSALGEAVEDFDTQGNIHIHGEIWQATANTPIKKGQTVRVTGMDGLVLSVGPVNTKEDTS